jgi:hypothetical protein
MKEDLSTDEDGKQKRTASKFLNSIVVIQAAGMKFCERSVLLILFTLQ